MRLLRASAAVHNCVLLPYTGSMQRTLESDRTRIYRELLEPCGRYIWSIPKVERLYAYLMSAMGRLEDPRVPLEGEVHVPQNWQRLARRLHEVGIAREHSIRLSEEGRGVSRMYMTMLLSRREETSFAYRAHCSGYAHTLDLEEALSKTVGETLERFTLSQPPERDLELASYNELQVQKRVTLPLHELPSFLPWQKKRFPAFDWDDDSRMYWVKGTSYPEGKETLIPAQLVFWTYRNQPKEKLLFHTSTSGCAGHFERDRAVLGALLELIQRDGFLIYWLNSLTPHRIDTRALKDETTARFVRSLEESGLTPAFIDVTTDVGVPTCVCALVGGTESEPVLSIGASAGFDERSTILQSATEALTVLRFSERNRRYHLSDEYEPFTDPNIRRDERIFAWHGREMIKQFGFFTSGAERPLSEFLGAATVDDPTRQLDHVLTQLKRMGPGYETYVYDAKDSILTELGYRALRVIVPALMPLYLNEYAPTLDSKRLREVPGKLGHAAGETYNPWPHPFP